MCRKTDIVTLGKGKTMCEVCTDNRFELIEKYKAKLIEATNIECDTLDMAAIDSILFRFWQMGWLDKLDADAVPVVRCEDCKYWGKPNEYGFADCAENTDHGWGSNQFCVFGERKDDE